MSTIDTGGPAKATAEAVRLEKRPDGVALLILDTPESPVNVLSRELLDEIAVPLDEIEGDDAIRAVVLASGKPGTFIAGANVEQLLTIDSAEEAARFSSEGQRLLARMAGSRKPFVAAIHGVVDGQTHFRL